MRLRGLVVVSVLTVLAGRPAMVRAQDKADEADEPHPGPEPASTETELVYGRVDESTVRVFAIGTVGMEELPLHERRVKVAIPRAGHGTGFVAGHGLILTAHHVVEGARQVVVRLPGEK